MRPDGDPPVIPALPNVGVPAPVAVVPSLVELVRRAHVALHERAQPPMLELPEQLGSLRVSLARFVHARMLAMG